MFSSVRLPTGGIAVPHFIFFCGWNSIDTSLGHWNKACSLGFMCLRKLSRVTNLKHFTVGFVGVICPTTFMIFRCKGAANLIVTSPLKCVWPFPDFHVPFYRNKRLCKAMQCGGFETDPRYPMRRSNYPVSYSCCCCLRVIRFSWVAGPAFPFCIICLQRTLRTLLDFWKTYSPAIDHGLLFGGCLKYPSMAARIALRDETLNSVPSSHLTAV